jgi:predicted dehydrogenase
VLRLGLIGCGAWGWRYLPAALEAGGCAITHIARVSRAITEAWPFVRGAKRVHDWRLLLHEPLDAFIVATPPSARVEIVCELLFQGRPVMVEKPMALGERDARVIEISARRSAPLLVNHIHLFAPAYEELRDRALMWRGRIDAVARGGGAGPAREYSSLWDYGPHDVAMVLGLCGGEKRRVVEAHRPTSGSCAFEMRAGRVSADVRVWSDARKQRSFDVVNEDGDRLVYDDLSTAKLRQNGVEVPVSSERPLTRSLRSFVEAVRTGRGDWRFGAQIGLDVCRMLDGVEALAG